MPFPTPDLCQALRVDESTLVGAQFFLHQLALCFGPHLGAAENRKGNCGEPEHDGVGNDSVGRSQLGEDKSGCHRGESGSDQARAQAASPQRQHQGEEQEGTGIQIGAEQKAQSERDGQARQHGTVSIEDRFARRSRRCCK